jgi:hypothetical protein
MKTRTKKGPPQQQKPETTVKTQQLEPSISNPPKVFILPKETSKDARIITITANSTSNRYLVCPEKGFYEFTRISAPKRNPRSWLLAPDRRVALQDVSQGAADEGYVLQSPELMIATPIDPLFILLPALLQDVGEPGGMQMYLNVSDYIDKLSEQSPHLRQIMRDDQESGGKLERTLDRRMCAVCDEMEAGEEKLYKLSHKTLAGVLVNKARKMVEKGLPASMEERFVKQALAVPVMSVKREESGMSITADVEDEDATTSASQSQSQSSSAGTTSQISQSSTTTVAASDSTAATSTSATPPSETTTTPPEIPNLLHLRTALDYLLKSYIPTQIHEPLDTHISSLISFTPLTAHLANLDKLKKEAQALRSLSENISRKRGLEDDEEAMEKAEAKKRKKEEEEFRKKNVSRGVQQLKKADTSGMKKLSSFFGRKGG